MKRGGSELSAADRKRAKWRDARKIIADHADPAINGSSLDVSKMLQDRKNEVYHLDSSMKKSKNAGAKRAMQKLSRELRRRTASHNVKRVPSKYRARASEEMIESGKPLVPPKPKLRGRKLSVKEVLGKSLTNAKLATQNDLTASTGNDFDLNQHLAPTSKYNKSNTNGLALPPPGKTKYQHRQRKKTWIPTHVWHAKRAHLAEKWGFSIVTEPSLKSYRQTHRSSTRTGAVVWDVSYYATFILSGTQEVLEQTLKKITQGDFARHTPLSKQYFGYEKVIEGNTSWEGMAYETCGALLAPILVVWKKESEPQEKRRVLFRCHPAATLRVVNVFNTLRKETSNSFDYHDYRYLLGSIDITGPESTAALSSVLKVKPDVKSSSSDEPSFSELSKYWNRLGNVSNISSLPRNVVISLNCTDPRLSYPPQYMRDRCDYDFAEMVTNWPEDAFINPTHISQHGSVFDEDGINKSYQNQSTQKSIGKRRAAKTEVGVDHDKLPFNESDPIFPVLVVKRKAGDLWTVILPWGWVLPVWYSLNHHNNVKIGGINQRHQLDFEAGRLYFPKDFPGTIPGDLEADEDSREARLKWARKPINKRISYRRLLVHGKNSERGEIGSPFRCDWKFLWMLHNQDTKAKEEIQRLNLVDPQDLETSSEKESDLGKAILDESKEYVRKTTIADMKPPTKSISTQDTNLPEFEHVNENETLQIAKSSNDTTENADADISMTDAQDSTDIQDNSQYIAKVLGEEITKVPHHYVTFSENDNSIDSSASTSLKPLVIKPVKVQCVTRGTPQNCARLYKIPPGELEKWLHISKKHTGDDLFLSGRGLSMQKDKTVIENSEDSSSLDKDYPVCPSKEYLIGYITTGSFNLKEARGTGVGAVMALNVKPQSKTVANSWSKKKQYCLVRNVGSMVTRLATFEEISLA